MKKLITLFLTLTLLGAHSISFADDATNLDTEAISPGDQKAVSVIRAIGIMRGYEDGSFHPNDSVTRAEFATVICNIYGGAYSSNGSNSNTAPSTTTNITPLDTDEWQTEFNTGKYLQSPSTNYDKVEAVPTQSVSDNTTTIFNDVPTSYWAYTQIYNVLSLRMMVGTSDTTFEPDRAIEPIEAAKTMVSLLGYSTYAQRLGGYPNGYLSEASALGLLDGIDMSTELGMTRSQMAHIIYNALDVKPQVLNVGSDNSSKLEESDKTLLESNFDILKTRGTLTDNGIANVYGDSEINNGEVLIDDVRMDVPSSLVRIFDEIGAQLEAYYRFDEDTGENTLVYYELTGKDDIITIDARDIDYFTSNSIMYTKGSASKNYTLQNGTRYIYNGCYAPTLTPSMRNVRAGWIKIIKGSEPLVIIKSYRSIFPGNIDTTNYKLYDKVTPDSPVYYNEDKSNKYTVFRTTSGDVATETNVINSSVILLAEGTDYMEFIGDGTVVTGAVENILDNTGIDSTITLNSKEYKYSTEYYNSKYAITLAPGDDITAYINTYDQIVWLVGGSGDNDLDTGYVYKAYYNTDDELWYFKIFTTYGSHEVVPLAKSLGYYDEEGGNTGLKDTAYSTYFTDFRGFISYSTNSDGEIKRIEVPLEKEDGSNRMHKIAEISPATSTGASNYDTTKFQDGSRSFAQRVYVNLSTKIVEVPGAMKDINRKDGGSATEGPDSQYKVSTYSHGTIFQDYINYKVIGYTTEKYSTVAQYVVYYNDSNSLTFKFNERLAVVTDIYKGINDEGENANILKVMHEGNALTLFEGEGVDFTCVNSDLDEGKNKNNSTKPIITKHYSLGKGDIVRYITGTDGKVSKIALVFDNDGIDPSTGERTGYTPGVDTEFYFVKNDYVGDYLSIPTWATGNFEEGNPYNVNGYAVPAFYARADGKVTYGYVYSCDGTSITITTQNLHRDYDFLDDGVPADKTYNADGSMTGVYFVDNYPLKDGNFYRVVTRRGNVSVEQISASEFITFRDAGQGCSKIVASEQGGYTSNLFLIDNEE